MRLQHRFFRMLLLLLHLVLFVAQYTPINSVPNTFAVAPVEFGNSTTNSITLADAAKVIETFWAELHKDDSSISPLDYETGAVNNEDLVESTPNAFIGTVLLAYNKHLQLILSPDDFWLLISLGASQFLAQPENAEKYRHTFVYHEGKETLAVEGKLVGVSQGGLAEVFTKRFSTTSAVEATVFQISLMEAAKNYFEYAIYFVCGIPEITLEGTEGDYQDILIRIDALTAMLPDFEWYLNRTKGHMQKVLDSKKGHPDIDWWRRMVRNEPEGSGGGSGELIGWMSDFFPYKYRQSGEVVKNEFGDARFNDFRSPVVTFTPVIMEDNMITYNLTLVGGFVGTATKKSTDGKFSVRPSIGWFMYYWNN